MMVEEGDRVKKGQVLFRLDGANQSLGVSQAEAALATALVGENTAKTELDRTKSLYEAGSVAPAVYDGVKARYDAAKAGVEQARAAVASVRQFSADTAVHSPIDGVVSARRASVGETVTMMPPTVVLVVQDITQLEVRGRVPEMMLAKIKPGSLVRVRFPAVNLERVVPVERINPSVDPMTRTIEVVALVPNADSALKAGMLVELRFNSSATPAAAPSAFTKAKHP
jgi:RND family efflux transporter MFP subunit